MKNQATLQIIRGLAPFLMLVAFLFRTVFVDSGGQVLRLTVFWSMCLLFFAFEFYVNTAMRLGWTIMFFGLLCNISVTMANGAYMPVLSKMTSEHGMWIRALPTHHLLFLCDRFAGFSVGDFFILGGALLNLSMLLIRGSAWARN